LSSKFSDGVANAIQNVIDASSNMPANLFGAAANVTQNQLMHFLI
jgi:hypothetical protein